MDAISLRKLPWTTWIAGRRLHGAGREAVRPVDETARRTCAELSAAVERFARDTGEQPRISAKLLARPQRLAQSAGKWPYYPPAHPAGPVGQPTYTPALPVQPGQLRPVLGPWQQPRADRLDRQLGKPVRLRHAIEGESLVVKAKSADARPSVRSERKTRVTTATPRSDSGGSLGLEPPCRSLLIAFAIPQPAVAGEGAGSHYMPGTMGDFAMALIGPRASTCGTTSCTSRATSTRSRSATGFTARPARISGSTR